MLATAANELKFVDFDKFVDFCEVFDYLVFKNIKKDQKFALNNNILAEGRSMNIQTSREVPVKISDVLDRGTEIASRACGLAAFGICIISLAYLIAF